MSLASSLAMASVCLSTTPTNPGFASVSSPYISSSRLLTLVTNPGFASVPSPSRTFVWSLTVPTVLIISFSKSSTSEVISLMELITPFPFKGSASTSSAVASFGVTLFVFVSTSYTISPALKPFKVNVLL